MATLSQYQEVMPTVFAVMPTLTKTTIDNKMASIPARPVPTPIPALTPTNIANLFNEIYAKTTIEEAIQAAGGIRALASKHSMDRSTCVQLIQEFEKARALYQA